MNAPGRREKAARIRRLLETEGEAVGRNTRGFNAGRYASVDRLDDYQQLRDRARALKEDAIERLPELIDRLAEAVRENGGRVHRAADAADARGRISEICAARGAERVVKSKSMTTEEIELNRHLGDRGLDVVETDLGEWILQVAGEAPSHIVAPAIHKSRDAIARLLNERFEPEEPLETAEEMTRFARRHLRERIKAADVGVTGANFLAAETGTLALVTSEGNARQTTVVPDTHVAVAGVEKILPDVESLRPFVELIARSATGQDLSAYLSLLTPPVDSPVVDFGDPDTPITERGSDRAFHLVLVDNGRLAMREDDDLRETLYCIRCGACSNSCANFQSVGGHAFGGETYSGGIATGWEAGVHGLDAAGEFNDLCTGCSRCVEACPVKIDIPWINTVVRDRLNRREETPAAWLADGLTPDAEEEGPGLQKRFFGNVESLARLGSALAPVSNWIAGSAAAGRLLERVAGVDRRRELPTFRRETLVEWFAGRTTEVGRPPTARAVLYPDLYSNHMLVDRGKAAVRLLEALGVELEVPESPESGRAPLSQGMIATARSQAERVAETLAPYLRAGRDVVVVEPSDLAMFRGEYRRLLPGETSERLAGASHEVVEYVRELLSRGADPEALPEGDGESVAYHRHCQQRTMGLAEPTVATLAERGYEVTTTDVECCGMAGSFGYKEQYCDLSMAVGSNLADRLRSAGAEHVVASGTSCAEQIAHLIGERPLHPVELLAPGRPGGSGGPVR